MSGVTSLERMLNRTTLSTQRALHTHILGLGETFLPPPPSTSSRGSSQRPRLPSLAPHPDEGVAGVGLEEPPWVGVFPQGADEEREKALRLQEEHLQVRFKEALLSRERLEAERRQGERVERQARLEAQRAGVRAELEGEMRRALEEVRERARDEARREAEDERRREAEAMNANAQEDLRRCVWETEVCVRQLCEREAERERQSLQDSHAMELAQMQSRVQQLEESLTTVTGERLRYEHEYKMLECSYRQFVDLTSSSLHSDYLLKRRRLGREPGYAEAAAQTDEVISTRHRAS